MDARAGTAPGVSSSSHSLGGRLLSRPTRQPYGRRPSTPQRTGQTGRIFAIVRRCRYSSPVSGSTCGAGTFGGRGNTASVPSDSHARAIITGSCQGFHYACCCVSMSAFGVLPRAEAQRGEKPAREARFETPLSRAALPPLAAKPGRGITRCRAGSVPAPLSKPRQRADTARASGRRDADTGGEEHEQHWRSRFARAREPGGHTVLLPDQTEPERAFAVQLS